MVTWKEKNKTRGKYQEKGTIQPRGELERVKGTGQIWCYDNQYNLKTSAHTMEPLDGQQKGYECTKILIDALLTG